MEAAQDVFVQVLRRKNMEINHPSSMLWRTATNVCLNKIRSRNRHPEDLSDDLVTRIAIAPVAEKRGIAAQMLDRLFSREKASTRTIATLHLLDGMTLEEVASEVGLSVSGVRKRLRVLRVHLHELEGV